MPDTACERETTINQNEGPRNIPSKTVLGKTFASLISVFLRFSNACMWIVAKGLALSATMGTIK